MELVSPLIAEGIDAGRLKQMKEQICQRTGISERTLRRYLSKYKEQGFNGLKPKERTRLAPGDAVPANVFEQAVLLRREVPSRSVAQIIQILEWEGIAQPGQIKRSTLQEKLSQSGYSTRHMKMYQSSGVAARRFQQKNRNTLWHSDIKYGPYLPIGVNGEKKQVYLVTFFDDATRFVLHGEFYPTLDQVIVESCFRSSIMEWGVPDSVYFDNGKQYSNTWMRRACGKLGIRLLYAKPYSPEATGKIERFNRVVDSFLSEAALEKPQTLEKLNQLFQIWLEECYQNKPHSALKDNITPSAAYMGDSKPLRFLDVDVIADAFLHCEERKVDKAGCISFNGRKYEVGISFIGSRVNVIYDPADIRELTIEHEGYTPWKATELTIGPRTGKRPQLPEHMNTHTAESSRLFDAARSINEQRKERQANAISFRTVRKEGEPLV
jgi:transposase InsO family protein